MSKKVLSVLCIFSLLLVFPSCSRQLRTDFSELLMRIKKSLPDISLNLQDAFYSDGEWFLFVSVCSSDDILLTAVEDEDKYIMSVGISTVRIPECEEQKKRFVEFCDAAAVAFMSDTPTAPLLEELGIYDEALIFSEEVRFSEYKRFSASFFNADMGSTVRITIG